ncbi:MAG: hypothetical protein RL681_649 [Candidatus Parcubacteria bacterium]|jgi:hypothetical protein
MRSLELGVDVGGTKIRFIVVRGVRVIAAKEFPTPPGASGFHAALCGIAAFAAARGIRTIGVGTAGEVRGTVCLRSANLPALRNYDFRRAFPRPFRVRVDNDARCFARAAMRDPAVGRSVTFCSTLGTGIGRAVLRDRNVMLVRAFEPAERWERGYQRLRSSPLLAEFLAPRLLALARRYSALSFVFGGGTFRRKNFIVDLRSALRRRGFRGSVRESRLHQNSVAFGAVLLWRRGISMR